MATNPARGIISYYHQAALDNNGSIDHPNLRPFAHPMFDNQSICLHTTNNFGFICLTSDERFVKEKDLEFLHKIKKGPVPQGTTSMLIATDMFKFPAKESKDLPEGVILPPRCIGGGMFSVMILSNRVELLEYVLNGRRFTAGIYIQPAFDTDSDSLTESDAKFFIKHHLTKGNFMNEIVMHLMFNPPTFTLAPDGFPKEDRIIYGRKCDKSFCPVIGWITEDNQIEFHNYDKFGRRLWSLTTCGECLTLAQSYLRKLGYTQSFTCPDYDGVEYTGDSLFLEKQPDEYSFPESQILCAAVCNEKTEGYYFVMKPDGLISVHCYNWKTEEWSRKIQRKMFRQMITNVGVREIQANFCPLTETEEGYLQDKEEAAMEEAQMKALMDWMKQEAETRIEEMTRKVIEKVEAMTSRAAKSESVKAEATKTEATKAEAKESEAKESEAKESEAKESEAKESEAVKSEAVKPEAVKPEAVKPEAVKAEAVKAEAVKAEAVKAEVKKVEAVKAEVTKVEAVKAEVTKAEVKDSEAVKPEEVKKVEATKVEATNSEAQTATTTASTSESKPKPVAKKCCKHKKMRAPPVLYDDPIKAQRQAFFQYLALQRLKAAPKRQTSPEFSKLQEVIEYKLFKQDRDPVVPEYENYGQEPSPSTMPEPTNPVVVVDEETATAPAKYESIPDLLKRYHEIRKNKGL